MAEPEVPHLPIVVGVDGSPPSSAALRWAYEEAVREHAPLLVATVWPSSSREGEAIATEADAQAVAVHAVVSHLPAEHATKVSVRWCEGRADDVLLERGEHAGLLVVGPHSHHSVAEHLLGSVTERLLIEASCPTAVVPPPSADRAPSHRVLVGVDGSPASQVALRWAAARARRTGSAVEALLVWDWRPEYGPHPHGPEERQHHARAEAALVHAVTALPEPLRALVRTRCVRGNTVDSLVYEAGTADLVVLGNRRRSRVRSHLAGSVSRDVALHAGVPVVVTHAADPDGAVVP